MVKDFEILVSLCDEELRHREYLGDYYARLIEHWDKLRIWMAANGLTEFSEEVGNKYLTEVYGTHLLPIKSPIKVREGFRAVRMLISYQKCGEFEFRSPSVEYTFEGNIGKMAYSYLEFCRSGLGNAQRTLDNKRLYLHDFSKYMDDFGMSFSDLSIEAIEDFFKYKDYSLSSRHNGSRVIRHFLQYTYDNGMAEKDCSIYVLKGLFSSTKRVIIAF